MKFGFIPTEGGHFYREFFDEVIIGEELGFASVWLEEHHGVKNHYWPSPLMGLAGVAKHTDQIVPAWYGYFGHTVLSPGASC